MNGWTARVERTLENTINSLGRSQAITVMRRELERLERPVELWLIAKAEKEGAIRAEHTPLSGCPYCWTVTVRDSSQVLYEALVSLASDRLLAIRKPVVGGWKYCIPHLGKLVDKDTLAEC